MSTAETDQFASKPPAQVNKVSAMAPFGWLSKGFSDLMTAKLPSFIYGLTFSLLGLFLIYIARNNPVWSVALTSAFLLTGPFLAIGLYELSSQIEKGEKPCLIGSINKIRANIVHLGFFVVLLGILLMIWLRISAMVAGIFFDDLELITKGWSVLLDGGRSIEFILFFTFFGFFIAQLVFSISVVSIPMILDRKVDVITAVVTSLRVVIKNPIPMFIWAIIIVTLINFGILLAFFGLVIMLPIIGHASWHAYKELVGE